MLTHKLTLPWIFLQEIFISFSCVIPICTNLFTNLVDGTFITAFNLIVFTDFQFFCSVFISASILDSSVTVLYA
jgi:hypothetical protein